MQFFFILVIVLGFISCKGPENSAKLLPVGTQLAFAENKVIAHRGAWKKEHLPENSIAALKQAILLKCAGSEFDVRMTADDSLVINHDPEFNKLPVEKAKYADLLAFSLTNGEKLPTLREYILAGMDKNSATRLVCEIKPSEISKERSKLIAQKVVNLIQLLKAEQYVTYISFDYDILKKILSINPKAITQYLNGNISPVQLKTDGIAGADYHFSVYQKHSDWIETAKKQNIVLNAWTVNEVKDMEWLLANEVDYITTNEPELLLERLKLSPVSNGWKLVWADEFNYAGLPDSSKWGFQTGGNGWGNNELQYYTANDTNTAMVANGILKITALKQETENREYKSARLVTAKKAEFKYGRIESRAKVPAAVGTWPAIWMLGANIREVKWPACGEIDIMEHRGMELDKVHGTLHYPGHSGGNAVGKTIMVPGVTTAFHKYAVEWDAIEMKFFVDDSLYFTIPNSEKIPFNHDFFIILNLALGGNFGGEVDPAFLKDVMEVDYVRVFQRKG